LSIIFQKSWLLWGNVVEFCKAEQIRDDILAHTLCMLDNWG